MYQFLNVIGEYDKIDFIKIFWSIEARVIGKEIEVLIFTTKGPMQELSIFHDSIVSNLYYNVEDHFCYVFLKFL